VPRRLQVRPVLEALVEMVPVLVGPRGSTISMELGMKGFYPLDKFITQKLEDWALNWAESHAKPGEVPNQRAWRAHHHAEYLDWSMCDGNIILSRDNGGGYFISQDPDEIKAVLDTLEFQLNEDVNPVLTVYGAKLNEEYHVVEDEVDRPRLVEIVNRLCQPPHFKHLDPIKEEVVYTFKEAPVGAQKFVKVSQNGHVISDG